MKYSPSMIAPFITRLEQATSEQEIQSACQEIKLAICERYENENSRRRPMAEIRKAVRKRFPAVSGKSPHEAVPFPYYFTNSGKGKIERWEHLAVKHLAEEWNSKPETVKPETVTPEVVTPEEVTQEAVTPEEVTQEAVTQEVVTLVEERDILGQVGLTTDEVEFVKQAANGADIREWVKQAILQRANAINRKNAFLDEDLTEISSKTLMEEKKYRSSPVASRELVNRAVRVVKQWNLDHPDGKWCITNKILGELTGVTVKAVAKAVEGMDLASYNQGQGLEPLVNRFTKAAVGNPSEVMSLDKVTGVEDTEKNYTLHAVAQEPTKTIETKKKIKQLPANGTSTIDIQDFLKSNPDYMVSLKGEDGSVTYASMNNEKGVFIGMKCLESGEEIKEI